MILYPVEIAASDRAVDRLLNQPADVTTRFGSRLRQLRLEHNLTQAELADTFGIDRSFISNVERGQKSISLPLLEILAIGFRLSLSELFDGL